MIHLLLNSLDIRRNLQKYSGEPVQNSKKELYLKKMTNDSFLLDAVQKEKLMEWFGEEITYCKQSLEEIGIMFD